MGKKYLGLDDLGVKIVITDAEIFLATKSKFDLICIDLYVGDKYPDKFESEKFITLVKKTLSPKGIAVFNRLYYGEKRKEAALFGEKLKKHFYKVDWFFPEAMRTLALTGADIVAHPSNLVLPYCPDSMPLRCLENRVFAITANRTGTENRKEGPSLRFIGKSLPRTDGWESTDASSVAFTYPSSVNPNL